jgi:hypothetical protein
MLDHFLSWLLDPTKAAEVAAWSFSISLIGLLVSILGFCVTIFQISRATSAAEAAVGAVKELKARVEIYDVVFDLSRVKSGLEESQRHLHRGNLSDAIESLSSVRSGLVRISEMKSAITQIQKDRMTELIGEISNYQDKIRRAMFKGSSPVDLPKMLSVMSKHYDAVSRVLIHVEGSL